MRVEGEIDMHSPVTLSDPDRWTLFEITSSRRRLLDRLHLEFLGTAADPQARTINLTVVPLFSCRRIPDLMARAGGTRRNNPTWKLTSSQLRSQTSLSLKLRPKSTF
jgi:hypothetical protein